ncbi:hypothetical protein CRUP_028203, partial [Coryphaenoides rupestris]
DKKRGNKQDHRGYTLGAPTDGKVSQHVSRLRFGLGVVWRQVLIRKPGSLLLCCLQGGATSTTTTDEVPVFSEEPQSVVQKLGGSVTLRCVARPASANISWRLDGREVSELADAGLELVLGPGTLLIPALSNRTVGRYQCVAATAAGALASVPANVTAAKLRDFEPDAQQDIEVDEGNTAIANATEDDEGPYKCAAYNPITQEVKTSVSADRLRIRRATSEAARITYPPASRSIMVTRGQRLVLECVASGSPPPLVTWAKDGQDLRRHNHTRLLLSNLLIETAGEGDSGTYVTVVLQPQGQGVEVSRGDTVRFSCQTRGKPAPAVVWLHNARPLAPSPRHRISLRALRVLGVGAQDEGLYQCMAENTVGSAQAAARLVTVPMGNPARAKLPPLLRPLSPDKVLREQAPVRTGAAGAMLPLDCSQFPGHISPAEAPIILSQPRTGKADFYELTWRPRHDGGAPLSDAQGEWTSSGISGALHKLTLAKLQPDSLYEVEMAAKNCAGVGQPAMMTFRTGKGAGVRGTPEAPDKPTISTATETSAYVTWIPRGNRGFPIQSFRVEYKKVKKAGEDWVTAVANIPPSRLSVEIVDLEKGTSYKFRVVAVNVIGCSPPSAPSKAYTVVGGRTNERPYASVNNTPIYGFYIFYRPTDSDNDSDYKKAVVEGDRYWHSITDLQPETAYDIKMQCFNEGGESEFGNVVILETKARPNQPRAIPSETPLHGPEHSGGAVPRPSDLPYLIVGVVLGALVFIIVTFIPFCLWRAWAKQ